MAGDDYENLQGARRKGRALDITGRPPMPPPRSATDQKRRCPHPSEAAGCARLALTEPAPPPPSKRTPFITILLAVLLLLLVISLIAVMIIYFQKERKLQELADAAQKYSVSIRLCNGSHASLEKSKRSQLSQNISVSLSEIQACLENTRASHMALQERYRNLLQWVSAGWKIHSGSFYFFSKEAKPWQEAEQACESLGTHLTSVSSQEEMEFLVRESAGEMFWIGLTERSKEGNWIWTDGTEYNHQMSFWGRGQPDNANRGPEGREDCVHFGRNTLDLWNDYRCGAAFRWVCKKVFS